MIVQNQRGTVPILIIFAVIGVIIFLLLVSAAPFKDKLFSIVYPKPSSNAVSLGKVTISNGKLFVDGYLYKMKAINYNPISIDSDQIDPNAPASDVSQIAAMGANTIATYTSTKIEWANYTNAGSGDLFYDNLVKAAQLYNIKLVIGYFSNQAIDWTDPSRLTNVTQQYQSMVNKAKANPTTLIYMIGNETFEKMSNDTQRTAYAKWIGQMVDWTHLNDPLHPVMYADNDQMVAMNWLKTYAPSLDIYGYNNYVWSSVAELKTALLAVSSGWPGKPILLHEWGVDSFDVPSYQENQSLQASRISDLRTVLDQVYADSSVPLLGDIFFEYTDDWNKLGTSGSQTPDNGWAWGCKTPFDSKCNEEYWGIASAAKSGSAGSRVLKSAYLTLKTLWASSSTPTSYPTISLVPTSTPTPRPTLTPLPTETIPPTVSTTSPVNGASIRRNTNITVSAVASDNVAVAKVQFYLNGGLKCTDTISPYSCTAKIGVNTNTITAKAYDTSGNTSSSTASVIVK